MVRNISIGLNRIGVHTDVMTFNMDRKWDPKWKGKTEKIEDITVFRIPALNWLPIEHSPRITFGINLIPGRFTKLLKRYDIIHFHEDLSFPLFSLLVKKPKILHLHGVDVDFYKRYYLSKFIFKQVADLYISISNRMKKDLKELGIPECRISYLPNGVNPNFFSPSRKKEENLLLFVGRITSGKGLHVLLESLSYLREPIHLVIIGPPDWDLQYHQKILKTVNKENREGKHKITYLGSLDQAEIVKWYQKASVFVLPSFWEAFPVVILEALACATPVIATPVGGVPEVIQSFENGILVPLNNPLKLAEAIQYLLDNKDARIRLGRAGRKLIVKHFSLDVVVSELYNIYKKLVSR